MPEKSVRYMQKKVSFNGSQMTLFSIDGATWSSRKDELETIADRHEEERLIYGGQIKSGPQAKKKIQEEASAAREKKAQAKKDSLKKSSEIAKERDSSKVKPKVKKTTKNKSVA